MRVPYADPERAVDGERPLVHRRAGEILRRDDYRKIPYPLFQGVADDVSRLESREVVDIDHGRFAVRRMIRDIDGAPDVLQGDLAQDAAEAPSGRDERRPQFQPLSDGSFARKHFFHLCVVAVRFREGGIHHVVDTQARANLNVPLEFSSRGDPCREQSPAEGRGQDSVKHPGEVDPGCFDLPDPQVREGVAVLFSVTPTVDDGSHEIFLQFLSVLRRCRSRLSKKQTVTRTPKNIIYSKKCQGNIEFVLFLRYEKNNRYRCLPGGKTPKNGYGMVRVSCNPRT